jgi:tetratricopeptide (TPR) repeat protein
MHLLSRFALVALAFGTLSVGACKKKGQQAEEPPPMPAMLNQGPPVTEAEAEQFSRELETAIAAGDSAKAEDLFRTKDLFTRCVADFNPPADMTNRIRQNGNIDLSKQIMANTQGLGSYKFLRVKTMAGRPRSLFRLITTDGTVNYHAILLARHPDGRVATEDVYIAVLGEDFSLTMRRLLLPALRQANRNMFEKLSGADKDYIDNMSKILTITQAVKTKTNGPAALAVYRGLPESLKNQKSIQAFALQVAMQVNEDEYLVEMERFRKNHAGDPSCDLISIDYYIIKKQYDKAIESIDQLAAWVGGDPYLMVLKANMYTEWGKYAEAQAEIDSAWKLEPKMSLAYGAYVTLACKKKDFKGVSSWMKKASDDAVLEFDPEAIVKEELYAEYIKSPEFAAYKTWWKARK